jgi:Tfp pilus assembly protein PilW
MSARLRDERGVTLIELLAALGSGLVVSLAGFALFDTTFRVSGHLFDRVDAAQLGRGALDRIELELHSACLAAGVIPIAAGSTASAITFVSAYGSSVAPTPVLHRISYAAGALTDSSYPMTGGVAPSWTFATTPSSTVTIASHVSQATGGLPSGPVPVFTYYAYTAPGQLASSGLATPLSSAAAASTVSVGIDFVVGASEANAASDAPITVDDTVSLRLSSPTDTSTAPCA